MNYALFEISDTLWFFSATDASARVDGSYYDSLKKKSLQVFGAFCPWLDIKLVDGLKM